MRVLTRFFFLLTALNAALLVGTAAIGIWLWAHGAVGAGIVAAALPLAWQLSNVAGWVSWEVTAIFENVGVVQEGMQSIAVPHAGTDRPGARPLEVSRGEIVFEDVSFGYGRKDVRPVLHKLTLEIKPGERVGLVGRSGVGKSTLVNLLLRFHDAEGGRILIDGQDIAGVTPGEPARRDRHGHAGHFAPASLDRREHPLRPAACERRAGHRRGQKGAGA